MNAYTPEISTWSELDEARALLAATETVLATSQPLSAHERSLHVDYPTAECPKCFSSADEAVLNSPLHKAAWSTSPENRTPEEQEKAEAYGYATLARANAGSIG